MAVVIMALILFGFVGIIMSELTKSGRIPYKVGGFFWEHERVVYASIFFGGIILPMIGYLFGWLDGSDYGCYIDWDGRANPLLC